MNLLHLASPIQEEILHWPDGTSQREPVSERALRRLMQIPSWSKQLELWRQLLPAATGTAGKPVALEEYAIRAPSRFGSAAISRRDSATARNKIP
jgi:hypothetical protein